VARPEQGERLPPSDEATSLIAAGVGAGMQEGGDGRPSAELRRELLALRAADALKASINEGSHDCISVLDLEGRLLSMNTGGMAALDIVDVTAVLNSPWPDLWQGADRESARTAVQVARQESVGRFVGLFSTQHTRRSTWWDVVVSPLRGADGKPDMLLAVARDVTAWKRADQLLRALTESTAATLGGDFFRSLVRHLATALGVRDAFVAECLPGQRARSLGVWNNGHPGDNFEYDLEGTPCLDVVEGRTCFYPSRLAEIFPKLEAAGAHAPVSYLGVPLMDAGQRVIGHLVVTHDRPMDEDRLLFSVVETFASRAGAELERARAAERERAILDVNNAIISNLTQDALLRAISESLGRVVPFDRAALALHEPKTDVLRILALEGQLPPRNYPVGIALDRKDSHVGWVFDHRRTLLRRDLEQERQFTPEHRLYEEGVRSLCTAPLILAGRCIGTITLGSTTPNRFTDRDAAFLGDVSNQLALAFSNMRSFEEIAELKARLQAENQYLQEEIRGEHNFSEIVGDSPALQDVLRQVDQVAPLDSTVLILGETGSGKELIARAIHDRSARKARSLVKVNCGAISAGLVESELFGHVKGAFTGALGPREGRFKLADGGTIFLDEVSELPLEAQVKLLRVLQEREFEPVGSSTSTKVDVRVIAASNRDLATAVKAGKFRSDLFYRLNVVPLAIPPLRERPGDVELLVKFFLQKFAKKFDRPVRRITPETMERLRSYPWPGNIRELQNVIERSVVLSRGDTLTVAPDIVAPEHLAPPASQVVAASPTGGDTLTDVERRHIESVLVQQSWIIEGERGAARVLGMHPNTLRSRIKKLGLRRPGGSPRES